MINERTYTIIEINYKHPKVNNMLFSEGQSVPMSQLKKYAASKGFVYDNYRLNERIRIIKLFDNFSNVLLQAESIKNV